MLGELAAETATLHHDEALLQQQQEPQTLPSAETFAGDDAFESDPSRSDSEFSDRQSDMDEAEASGGSDKDDDDGGEQQADPRGRFPQASAALNGEDATLSQVCYKSLSISVELARRVEQVSVKRVTTVLCECSLARVARALLSE